MGSLGLMTQDLLDKRTKLEGLKQEEAGRKEMFIDLAEDLLSGLTLDSGITGYTNSVTYAVQVLTEYLWLQGEEAMIQTVNNPFESERIGSYSYKKRAVKDSDTLFESLPGIVQQILRRYKKTKKPVTYTSYPFNQRVPDSLTGIVPTHDLLDHDFDKMHGGERT